MMGDRPKRRPQKANPHVSSTSRTTNNDDIDNMPVDIPTLNQMFQDLRNLNQRIARIEARLDNIDSTTRNTTFYAPYIVQLDRPNSSARYPGESTTEDALQRTAAVASRTSRTQSSQDRTTHTEGDQMTTQADDMRSSGIHKTTKNLCYSKRSQHDDKQDRSQQNTQVANTVAHLFMRSTGQQSEQHSQEMSAFLDQRRYGLSIDPDLRLYLVPLPFNDAFKGRLQAGYDHQVPGTRGQWEYLSSDGEGSSEELAAINLGVQGHWDPDTARPTAAQVHELRQRIRREIDAGSQTIDITEGIDIVWVIESITSGDVHEDVAVVAQRLIDAIEAVSSESDYDANTNEAPPASKITAKRAKAAITSSANATATAKAEGKAMKPRPGFVYEDKPPTKVGVDEVSESNILPEPPGGVRATRRSVAPPDSGNLGTGYNSPPKARAVSMSSGRSHVANMSPSDALVSTTRPGGREGSLPVKQTDQPTITKPIRYGNHIPAFPGMIRDPFACKPSPLRQVLNYDQPPSPERDDNLPHERPNASVKRQKTTVQHKLPDPRKEDQDQDTTESAEDQSNSPRKGKRKGKK